MYVSNRRSGHEEPSGAFQILSKNLAYKFFNVSAQSSAQALLIGTLFVQVRYKGWSVCMPTSQSHARAHIGVGHRECESKMAANPSKLAGWYQHKMHKGMPKRGNLGCSRLPVGAWQVMCAKASTSSCSVIPAASQSSALVSMCMDTEFQKEQICAHFCLGWDTVRRFSGVGVVGQGGPAQNLDIQLFFSLL